MIKKNIKGVKCNPLEMIVGSFMGTSEGNATFSQCMDYATSEDIINSQNELIHKNNKEYQKLIEDISNNTLETEKKQQKEKAMLMNLVNSKVSSIDDLIIKQNKINNTIIQSKAPINKIIESVAKVTTKFKDVIKNFKISEISKFED